MGLLPKRNLYKPNRDAWDKTKRTARDAFLFPETPREGNRG